MADYNKFQQFVEDMAHGVHDFSSDTLKVALVNSPAPTTGLATRSQLTEITYTNLPGTTQPTVNVNTSGQSTGTYDLLLDDLTITPTGGPANAFQYVVLYNSTATGPTDPLICWFDYLSSLTLADGESLTVDFDSDGPSTGSLLTLA